MGIGQFLGESVGKVASIAADIAGAGAGMASTISGATGSGFVQAGGTVGGALEYSIGHFPTPGVPNLNNSKLEVS